MEGRFLNLFQVFRGNRKTAPGAAPAQQPEEPEQFQPLQDDAAMDERQEQEPARGRFRRTLKRFRKFLRIGRRKNNTAATEGTAEPDSGLTELQAEPDVSPDSAEPSQDSDAAVKDDRAEADMAGTEGTAIPNDDIGETQGTTDANRILTPTISQELVWDYFKDPRVSSDIVDKRAAASDQQVPSTVRNIHQSLVSHVTVDIRQKIDIIRLAEEHPVDVVLTLLRCAPSCDRAAAMMWQTIASSGPTVEKVLPTLLCVMENWPLCSTCTSDGDNKDVLPLSATLVLWMIVQMPQCHEAMMLYSARLFVALLFHVVITTQQSHVVITTQQMPPVEADSFWKACREQHRLPSNANRFAVQVMKSLLCRLRCDNVVMEMGRKRGWDTLLCADTQHYAVGLLAREMRRGLIPFCSRIAIHLLKSLRREEPCCDLSFLAFLVEVLECLDLTKYGDGVLEIASRHLQSECRQRRRLALRGLVVLSKDPSMAIRMCSLSQSLQDLLADADGDVVGMALRVFINMLNNKDIMICSTTAPKLAQALLLLFDHDHSHVQLLSLDLFFKAMDLVVDEGKKPLEKILDQSLIPLFIHCHDENRRVAKASRETLLRVAEFLKRRNLKRLVRKEQLSKFAERLLAQDKNRAAEHLCRALPYLDSPQEPLREAAVRFLGMAGEQLRGQQEELQTLIAALQALKRDDNPSERNTVLQQTFIERTAELRSSAGLRNQSSCKMLRMMRLR
ncbi:LOW QUALITY PROTEIN: maestro heat-like repeat-containing protein family member 6 [Cyanistes caeruleus]|uniref:LOW QUALITY PROTEIN: maestro heat-like repeat-containing protein family member 6 n=1 Tax=Cyanistes caeruleus TaxID=156563 RepID=UPI000CDAC5BF|nr:LOW QUALITY PROTEIN: maestro heat-like repeat-containing protein family member 6 [Cyanistes caeruleus]